MLTSLKSAAESLFIRFDRLLDLIFPYKKYFELLQSENFLNYYHQRIHKITFRLLIYSFPFLCYTVFLSVWTAGAFFMDLENLFFINTFLAVLFFLFGIFFIYSHKISGCFLLLMGLRAGTSSSVFHPSSVCLVFLLFIFLNLCRLRRLEYYALIARNVAANKLKNKMEDDEIKRLLDTYTADYDKFYGKQ